MIRLLALLAWPAISGAQPSDGPDLPLPPGATLRAETVEAAASLGVPTGPHPRDGGDVPVRDLEGRIVRQAWQVPGALTPLQLVAPIRAALAEAGYEILLDCAEDACGGFDFRLAIEVMPAPEMYVDLGAFRYLSALQEGDEGARAVTVLASRSAGAGHIQITRLGPLEAPVSISVPVAAEPQELAAALERAGRAVLQDLSFATGADELGPGPFASLEALADYLEDNPDHRVALVGHTDATGPLEANIALSRRRAQAVLERLVEVHGISRDRLEAGGMGYLAPYAANLTQEGREANRRVEAVLLATE